MKIRKVVGPVALVGLLAVLPGCGMMKMSASEPTGQDAIAAGNAAYDRKDYAVACRELSKAGTSAGAETLTRAGAACAEDGRRKAGQAYMAALGANGGYAPALEGAGMEALAAGDLRRATDMLEAAARAGGRDPRAAVALGDAWLLSGQCDKAQAAYQEARNRDGSFAQAGSRLDAARLVCGPRKAAAAVGNGAPGAFAPAGAAGPTGTPPAAPAKDAGKPKTAPKTIDLNDI